MKKIAIVTSQFPKLTEAGGIAFVTGRLAHSFVHAGHQVDVIVIRTQIRPTRAIKKHFRILGINLITVSSDLYEVSPWWLTAQLNIDRTILEGRYDVVICQEWQGLLSLTSGLNLQRPPVITWLHGGVLYDKTGSERDFSSKFEFIDAVLEETQIANSDLVVSPSKYLIDFYTDYGWRIDENLILPYLLPEDLPGSSLSSESAEIVVVFVGALSFRKGFDQFLFYAQELAKSGLNFSIRIYGKPHDFDKRAINNALFETGIKYSVESKFSPIEIWEQLKGLNVTLFVPSRMDNSPGVIYEAISAGAKVLVSESNGGAELLPLFKKNIQVISQKSILLHLDFIKKYNRESVNVQDFNSGIHNQWEKLLDEVIEKKDLKLGLAEKRFEDAHLPTISVVITTKNRPDFFKAALDSVLRQSLLPTEIIVVDDTSDGPTDVERHCQEAISPVPIIYCNTNLFASRSIGVGNGKLRINKLAANARNFGASKSTCEVVSFLDDDNLYFPSHLWDSVKCLIMENAVAVAPFLGQLPTTKPLSPSCSPTQIAIMAGTHFGSLNLITNVSMDSEILIYRNVFESVGGFPMDSAPEDWGLALYLVSKNHKIATTGNVTLKYRLNNSGVMASMASANERWWEVDRASVSKHWAQESAWWINHLARNYFFMGKDFGIALSEKRTIQSVGAQQNKSYIRYGLSLVRKRQFVLLLFGFKKYLFRRKFL
jgi:glycosyltransferase involved in cell wall biosynthesis